MPSNQTQVELLGPYGVSAINTNVATTVNANVFAGLIVGATTGCVIQVQDGISATGTVIGLLSSVSAADYFMIPQALRSGQLTISSANATPISFYFR